MQTGWPECMSTEIWMLPLDDIFVGIYFVVELAGLLARLNKKLFWAAESERDDDAYGDDDTSIDDDINIDDDTNVDTYDDTNVDDNNVTMD